MKSRLAAGAVIALASISTTLSTAAWAEQGRDVEYKVNGENYEGYYITPAEKDAPLILLIHDWDGLTDYEVKRAQMLAEEGYAVFAADLFGAGVRPTEMKDKRQHTGELYKDRQKMRDLMEGAITMADSLGANTDNTVAMGYCFGGAAVLELARSGADMKGFVTFHGGLKTPDGQDYTKSKGNILVLHGAADAAIPMADFAGLSQELEQAGVSNEMIVYSGAPHAFTVYGSNNYRQDADYKSWQRFLTYLDEI
ncbi:dienelactone hydrolase family protein [Photobacterium sanctipauli]|uniref:Dienelactone hydrolase family protein n=1 Tax=Photobacterium sanctipauli TaxID=1342794 RepID=A0A2T3P0U7_9GAMM|nr:dienelactone hydrolase family protein [Photobacterium sanctipauli]PSW22127.1 dienelactone hydrolase family protein [Photobacterium sanctipauli]